LESTRWRPPSADPLEELPPRDAGAAAQDASKSRIADGDGMDDAALAQILRYAATDSKAVRGQTPGRS
jgi:hypothetical protein